MFHSLEVRNVAVSSYLSPANAAYIDQLLHQFEADPQSLEPTWRSFFEGLQFANGAHGGASTEDVAFEFKVLNLIQAYREMGHLIADVNPLDRSPRSHPLLDLEHFGLESADLDRPVKASSLVGFEEGANLGSVLEFLRSIYGNTATVEYGHISDPACRRWVQERVENGVLLKPLEPQLQQHVLSKLTDVEVLEHLIHTRFVGQKRFSGEGNDVMVPMMDYLVTVATNGGADEIVFGTAHRGRLALLAHVLQKDMKSIFAEFLGNVETETTPGDGDVKYHLGHSDDVVLESGKTVHLSLVPNPSHLETVDPIVMGIVRAKQKLKGDADRTRTIAVLMHGDASFAGQGIIYETLNMSELPGYTVGGTIHLIINNQLGFTTLPCDGRSTPNATDIAKMLEAPIFRVNADEPEVALRAIELACAFRSTFKRDVFIDLVGYRRYGHNEGDEPAFTQPLLYQTINHHPRVLELYTQKLVVQGIITTNDASLMKQKSVQRHESLLDEARKTKVSKHASAPNKQWKNFKLTTSGDDFFQNIATGVPEKKLLELGRQLITLPRGFHPHPKIQRFLNDRQEMIEGKRGIDWGFAEALAFASLMAQDISIRLAGQDCERGTFSHRHSVLADIETGARYIPLNHLVSSKADYEVVNSLLSEYGALGFEFGQSLVSPKKLVLWEGQFGDFANGAQIIIDQCIVGSAFKWRRYSGLVLLLPHGYEGQGPEHSSARPERYLQACAQNNIQVCNLSTPAQYFHVLRRHMLRDFRLPLIIMTPKSLLRHPQAVSSIADFDKGSFAEVLDHPSGNKKAEAIIITSGKMLYEFPGDLPILSMEQWYPFPEKRLRTTLGGYKKLKRIIWCQEEPQNMGGWLFMKEHLTPLLSPERSRRVDQRIELQYVGRPPQASTSGGYAHVHEAEQRHIVEEALGAL